MRLTKTPEERKLEIIETANRLFEEKGFSKTTVSDITEKMNVAKGTFYYYFKSKNEVVDAIVEHALRDIVERAKQLISMDEMDALTKLKVILGGHLNSEKTITLREDLHQPRNRELHEKMNVASIKALTPLISLVVEQGIAEGTFSCRYVEDTVGLLLTGFQFYLDEVLFDWPEEIMNSKRMSMITIVEICLGIEEGSLTKEE